ncbi:MAG TPA: dihydrofolate reductase family protein [Pseudonocardiaceae bacterium]|jgi:dihydrofolate reductase
MSKLIVFENVSLDGVIQDPTGDEGFNAVDWRDDLTDADREAWNKLILDDALGADALLLGRGGYEFFAARYPGRTNALADQMNGLPKYVVSSTLTDPKWHNTTVLAGDPLTEVERLKRTVDGEIRVYASARLLSLLLAHDLVDELRLAIFPVLMGAGNRVFARSESGKPLRPKLLRLAETRTVGENLLQLTHRRAAAR